MTIFGWFCISFAFLLLIYGLCAWVYNSAYQEGFKAGENWWWTLLRDVESAREELWREELKR